MPTLPEVTNFIIAVAILLGVIWLYVMAKPIRQFLLAQSDTPKRIRRVLKHLDKARKALPKPDEPASD